MPFWQNTTFAPTALILSTMPFSWFSSSSRKRCMEAGSRIWILASTSVFLISRAAERMAILAFLTELGHPRVDLLLVDDQAVDELGVGDGSAGLLLDLDVVDVDARTCRRCFSAIGLDGLDGEVGEVVPLSADATCRSWRSWPPSSACPSSLTVRDRDRVQDLRWPQRPPSCTRSR